MLVPLVRRRDTLHSSWGLLSTMISQKGTTNKSNQLISYSCYLLKGKKEALERGHIRRVIFTFNGLGIVQYS